ncbi:HAMP domain-containing protein [Patescibacteria group bacterium]
MKLRTRLYLNFVIIIVLLAGLVFVIFLTSERITKESKRHELSRVVHLAVSELNIINYEYLMYHEERMMQQWLSKYNSLLPVLAEEEEEGLIGELNTDYIKIGDLFLQVIANHDKRQDFTQEQVLQEERLTAQLLIKSQSIISDASKLTERSMANLINTQEVARNLILFLALIFLILLGITSLIVARSILRPLDKLTKGAGIIAKGDLGHEINTKSKDELGDLSRAFDKMTVSLKKSRVNIEKQIADRTARLEKINKTMVGRELKMIELKKEILELKKKK